jgi:hypothetical protein
MHVDEARHYDLTCAIDNRGAARELNLLPGSCGANPIPLDNDNRIIDRRRASAIDESRAFDGEGSRRARLPLKRRPRQDDGGGSRQESSGSHLNPNLRR